MKLLLVFAAVVAATMAEVYFDERFADGGTYAWKLVKISESGFYVYQDKN